MALQQPKYRIREEIIKMNSELISKAKAAKTPEELLCLAKENGEEMTLDGAKAYIELLHPKAGEIADEELDNVSGGGCYNIEGKLIVTSRHSCDKFECTQCGRDHKNGNRDETCLRNSYCPSCYYSKSVGAIMYCENYENSKK